MVPICSDALRAFWVYLWNSHQIYIPNSFISNPFSSMLLIVVPTQMVNLKQLELWHERDYQPTFVGHFPSQNQKSISNSIRFLFSLVLHTNLNRAQSFLDLSIPWHRRRCASFCPCNITTGLSSKWSPVHVFRFCVFHSIDFRFNHFRCYAVGNWAR